MSNICVVPILSEITAADLSGICRINAVDLKPWHKVMDSPPLHGCNLKTCNWVADYFVVQVSLRHEIRFDVHNLFCHNETHKPKTVRHMNKWWMTHHKIWNPELHDIMQYPEPTWCQFFTECIIRQFRVNLKYGRTTYTSVKHTYLESIKGNSVFFAFGFNALCKPALLTCGIINLEKVVQLLTSFQR
jgi:hypothetical protein